MPGEYDALSSQVTQLQQNKQDKVTFYNSEPLPSEGSDGDTRFVSIPGQGLFSFVKYMGHWYSRLYKDFVTTLEDEISQTVTTTIESTTSYSTLAISGNLSVGGATTFTGGTTGLLHEDLGDVDTGSGGPHNEYIKGSVFNSSVDFNTSGLDNSIASLTLALAADGGLTRSGGIKIDEAFDPTWSYQHIFTGGDSSNPGAIAISTSQSRKIKLTDTGKVSFISSTNSGDISFEGTSSSGPGSVLIHKAENVITGMSHTSSSVTLFIGDNDFMIGSFLYVTVGTGASASVTSALDKKWLPILSTVSGVSGLVTLTVDASGCANDTIGSGGMVRNGNHFGSTSFVSGFGGSGFRISNDLEGNGGHSLEVDNMTLRGTLSVYELLIQQIRATNGSLFISSCGKVDSITTATVGSEVLVMEDPGGHNAAPFVEGDILIVQRVKLAGTIDSAGDILKRIVREVDSVSNLAITLKTVTGWATSADAGIYEAGDELIRIGSTSDSDRQASIKLTADEDNAPYIDMKAGVTSWTNWSSPDTTKVRLGNLTGVSTNGPAGSLSGYGLWSDNAFLEGEIIATTGYIGTTNNGWSITSTGITNQSANSLISVGDTNTFDSATTSFYIDGNGQFSLKDKFKVESGGNMYLSYDATNYIKFSGTDIRMVNNNVTNFLLDDGGEVVMGNVGADKGNIRVYNGDLEARINADVWFRVDGSAKALYIGDGISNNNEPYISISGDNIKFRRKVSGADPTIIDIDSSSRSIKLAAASGTGQNKIVIGDNIKNLASGSGVGVVADQVLMGSWEDQDAVGEVGAPDETGILVKHSAGNYSIMGTNGFNRNGFEYPIHIYTGTHYGWYWDNGLDGNEVTPANTRKLSGALSGNTSADNDGLGVSNTNYWPTTLGGPVIGYYLQAAGYPAQVPAGRRLIVTQTVVGQVYESSFETYSISNSSAVGSGSPSNVSNPHLITPFQQSIQWVEGSAATKGLYKFRYLHNASWNGGLDSGEVGAPDYLINGFSKANGVFADSNIMMAKTIYDSANFFPDYIPAGTHIHGAGGYLKIHSMDIINADNTSPLNYWTDDINMTNIVRIDVWESREA